MAINLFSKTFAAHSSSSEPPPQFAVCEQDLPRAQRFMDDLREKGGVELAQRVTHVASGKEWAPTERVDRIADPSE